MIDPVGDQRDAQQPRASLDGEQLAAEGDLRLPNPPGLIRQFWQRHPWLSDALIAGAYALPVLVMVIVMAARTAGAAFDALFALCCAASVAAVLFRRRVPLIAFAVALASAALVFTTSGGLLAFGLAAVLYSIPVYDSNRNAWVALGCSVAALAVAAAMPWSGASGWHAVIPDAILLLFAVLIGVNIGNRKRYVQALIERAAQLGTERDQQARLASAAERARIAREMHDIVSHSLTVMVTLADGSAALVETDRERSRDAMLQVADTGRHALTDMRRMLGVLAESPAETGAAGESAASLSPQPTASDLDDLVDRFRAAGVPVRYTFSGVAPDDAALQLAVYRVVQEALTNVLRHAPSAAQVSAKVHYGEPVTVEVRNSQPASGSSGAPIRGAGRGLIGLRERIALYGGTLEAGPTSDGWRVLATIGHEPEHRNRREQE